MNNVIDEILQDDPRFRIIDEDGNIIYDNISIEMITAITQIGTALNKALFDSIKNDLNSRLLVSSKATQAEAEAGTNNTKYMTPLLTKKTIEAFKKIKYTKLDSTNLVVEDDYTYKINLDNYLTSTTHKVEIIMCIRFDNTSKYVDSIVNGNSFYEKVGGYYTTDDGDTFTIGTYLDSANLVITIFPKQHKISVKGSVASWKYDSPGRSGNEKTVKDIDLNYSYESISNITFGKPKINYNSSEPLSIIQYLG